MSELKKLRCEPCSGNAQLATETQIASWRKETPDWQLIERDGAAQLFRRVKTANFIESLDLAQRIGALAEASDHHPELIVNWGSLQIYWWTHKLRGLHRNDFIMAAMTDELLTPQ